MDILTPGGIPARQVEEQEKLIAEQRKLIEKQAAKPKIPKEIEKLTKALSNRRTPHFIIYVEDGHVKTIGKLETKDKEKTADFLKQTIDNHFK